MLINGIQFNCELADIIAELQMQLKLNNIPLLQKTIDTNNDIMVQCPYHGNGQERRPSAGIRKSDGQFHCFACGEVHSLEEVISHCFGHGDAFGSWGWKWLNKNFATIKVEERKDVKLDFTRNNSKNRGNSEGIKQDSGSIYVTEEELDEYRYTHPYWKKRGITDEGIIELFDLGYDRKTDCITFPIRDVYGRCLFVARRSTKTKYFNYPSGAEKPLYGLYELYNWGKYEVSMNVSSIGEIIVCESMLDALTAWQFGRYAVALNGLGNELQFKQLRELPCRKLIIATDNDKAGLSARNRIKQNVKNKIITEYIFPDGIKDLNDLKDKGFDILEEVF